MDCTENGDSNSQWTNSLQSEQLDGFSRRPRSGRVGFIEVAADDASFQQEFHHVSKKSALMLPDTSQYSGGDDEIDELRKSLRGFGSDKGAETNKLGGSN